MWQKVIYFSVSSGLMAPPRKYALTRTTVLDQWALKFTSVKTWLSKQNGTKASRALHLWYFCDWAGKNPDELLRLKSSYGSLDAERLLDMFVAEADFPDSTRFKSSIAVRSFFRCNYKRLESEAGKMEYVVKKERRIPTREQRLRLYEACLNPRDRALFCVDACSGMALETLSQLKWHHFEEDWQSQEIPHIHLPSSIIKGHGRGKYRGVMQEAFLTPETKQMLKSYRQWMTRKYGVDWNDDMNVFARYRQSQRMGTKHNRTTSKRPLIYIAYCILFVFCLSIMLMRANLDFFCSDRAL
jgi:hypothetical protein